MAHVMPPPRLTYVRGSRTDSPYRRRVPAPWDSGTFHRALKPGRPQVLPCRPWSLLGKGMRIAQESPSRCHKAGDRLVCPHPPPPPCSAVPCGHCPWPRAGPGRQHPGGHLPKATSQSLCSLVPLVPNLPCPETLTGPTDRGLVWRQRGRTGVGALQGRPLPTSLLSHGSGPSFTSALLPLASGPWGWRSKPRCGGLMAGGPGGHTAPQA